MRFILIDARHRRVWNCHVPVQIDEDYIASVLRCDYAQRVEMTDDMDLWVPSDPKGRSFRLFADGPEFFGDGFLVGHTRLDTIKSLPRRYGIEMAENWFTFPKPIIGAPMPRRQTHTRPIFRPASIIPYHRDGAAGARPADTADIGR